MARTYETAIVLGAKLASTFKSTIGGAGGALEKLGQQAAKIKSVDRSTEVFARLQVEMRAAEQRAHTAATTLIALAEAAAKTDKPTKELAQWLAAGEKEAKKAADAMDKARAKVRDMGLAMHLAGVDTSKLSSEQERLARDLAVTERRMAAVNAMQASSKRIFGDKGIRERRFGDPKEARIDKLQRQAGGLLTTAAGLGAAGVGAGVGLFSLLKRAADAGDAVDDASKRLHIGAAALQAFHLQGELAGATAEDVDNGLGKLAVNLGKVLAARKKGGGGGGFGPIEGLTIFGQGGGASAAKDDPFNRIGLSAKALAGQKPERQIEQIADAIAKLKTQEERAAATAAIFGKGSLKLLPILEGGGAALRQMREEGVRTGKFMSDEATQAASDFNDSLKELETVGINSVVNALGGTLLPVGIKTLRGLTTWIQANQATIRQWAEQTKIWIEQKAIPAIKAAALWFVDTGGKIVSVVTRVADLVGGFGNLAIAIAALKAAPLLLTLGQIVAAMAQGASGAFAYTASLYSTTTGLGAVAAGVAATAVAVTALTASFVAGLAAGKALDDWLGISDWASGLAEQRADDARSFEADATLREGQIAALRRQRAEKIAKRGLAGEGGTVTPITAAAPAAPAGPRTSPAGGGVVLQFQQKLEVTGATSKADVQAAIDAATPEMLAKVKAMLEAHEREKKRVSFQ